MSAAPPAREARPMGRRVAEGLEILGTSAVLLAYWGTVSVLARVGEGPSTRRGESVRPKG